MVSPGRVTRKTAEVTAIVFQLRCRLIVPYPTPSGVTQRITLRVTTCDINIMMLERDMEDLIAAHPEEFFPGHNLTLSGRQQTFAGIGRFDLLFKDGFGTKVLMELKAVKGE